MRTLTLGLLACMLSLSCKKSQSGACAEPDLDCSSIRCLVYYKFFEFRLVDKATGADLVFGTNPRYTQADIKLYADVARTVPISLTADDSKDLFRSTGATEEMYLEVAGSTVYKLNVGFRDVDCCSARVTQLQVNGSQVCSCCPDVIPVEIN